MRNSSGIEEHMATLRMSLMDKLKCTSDKNVMYLCLCVASASSSDWCASGGQPRLFLNKMLMHSQNVASDHHLL